MINDHTKYYRLKTKQSSEKQASNVNLNSYEKASQRWWT